MRIPGIKTAKAFSRWVQARVFGGAMILGYHRVAEVDSDEYEVCVRPDYFAEQMEMVSKTARPISLSKLIKQLKEGSLQPNVTAVTFDDGYADNLYQAKPILEKYQIPATIFICSGYAGKEFWWDELERLVISSKADPGVLRLRVAEKLFQWRQPIVSPGSEDPINWTIRRRFRQALYRFLLPLEVEERDLAMETVRCWASFPSHDSPTHRAMNHAELLHLAEGGLIEIGSHTRNHPMLPHLSLKRQMDEIMLGKQDLEEVLGQPVLGFAYPSLHDVIRQSSDRFALTRFWQKDVDGERFMRNLNLWMKMA
jgi:peptidoglycan/xylan/chitin deacetylase (PgdA/CDA1 family)